MKRKIKPDIPLLVFPVILQVNREETEETWSAIEIRFERFDELNQKNEILPEEETSKVPKMLKTKNLSYWDSEPPSIVEFYCDDDLENHCDALCGFYTNENFSLDEERTFENDRLLSLSCLESLSSLTEIKGK